MCLKTSRWHLFCHPCFFVSKYDLVIVEFNHLSAEEDPLICHCWLLSHLSLLFACAVVVDSLFDLLSEVFGTLHCILLPLSLCVVSFLLFGDFDKLFRVLYLIIRLFICLG